MISSLDALRLAADTGVLTLIWLVQLVIYPSLSRYTEGNLKAWHPEYTRRVTFVILPLMLSQLVLAIYSSIQLGGWLNFVHLLLVIIAWAITFIKAVPMHQELDESENALDVAKRLTQLNLSRTIVWTIAWLISIIAAFT